MPLNNGGRPWHPVDNPLAYRLLPSWLNAHLNHQLERLQANLQPGHERGSQLIKRFMAALPATLLVLMPLLALVLRLLYWRRPMGYLKHLVVALYSHCFLLLMLLALFLLSAARNAGAPAILTAPGFAAVWIWIPVYLWMMQRRVYGGGWLSNAVRYLVIGFLYFVMVVFVAMYAVLIGISS